MKKIKENYCYCSGITCALRESCKRWLPDPPDIKLWWIPVAYKQETKQCPHLDPINKTTNKQQSKL